MRLLLFIIITIINTVTSDRKTCWMGKCVRGEKDDITPYQSSVHMTWLDVRIQFWISFTYTHTHLSIYPCTLLLSNLPETFTFFQSYLPVKHFVWPYWSIHFLCDSLTTEGGENPLLYELDCTTTHMTVDYAPLRTTLCLSHRLSLFTTFPPCSLVVVRSSAWAPTT